MRIKYFEGLQMFTEPWKYLSSKLYNSLVHLLTIYSSLKFYPHNILFKGNFNNPQYFISLIMSHPGSLLCSPTTSYHIFLTCYFSDLLTCTYNMYNGISITQLLLLLYCLQCIQTLQVWMNTLSVFFWSITDTSVEYDTSPTDLRSRVLRTLSRTICDCLSENPPSSHLLVFQEIPF